MRRRRAIIIGGGLGGLAISLKLARRGWQVTVCEQGNSFGGKMNSHIEQGFRFDTGPSLITMPWIFEDIFKEAGAHMQDYVELVQMCPIADYVFADGARFSYSTSMPEWFDTLGQIEPRDVDGFLKIMELAARLFELSKETFLRRSPSQPPDARVFAALKYMPLRHGWGNYHKTVKAHFKSPYMIQLFDRYPTYVGSSPYLSPATLLVIPYIEYAFGGWYIKGGLYRIIESLVDLAERAGVTLLTNARVDRIEHYDKRVKGVSLANGTRMDAELVVMNGDASHTSCLLGERESVGMPPGERSMSGFVMLLGIKRELPELKHHTIYFSADYEHEFAELFDERRFPQDPTVYVNMPSRTDRSVVSNGGETLFVMANAPAEGGDIWNEEKTREAGYRVFERLRRSGFPDIESDIVLSEIWTPSRIESRYLMPGGAIYGTHSHGWKKAFLRPPNKDRDVGGLYYVGGSTHPGGGTPTVLLSAQITSELIRQHEE
jgi:phytoene desaturase